MAPKRTSATGSSAPRSRGRAATTLAVTTGLVAAVGVGFALGRAGEPRVEPPIGTHRLALANADLEAATSCDDLLESYVERGLDRVGPWGWDGGDVVFGGAMEGDMMRSFSAGDASTASEAEAPLSTPQTSRSTSNESGTNVQEIGVDEPDVVKVAGSLLVRLQGSTLRVYDVSGSEPVELSSLPLSDLEGVRFEGGPRGELLLVDGRVVVLGGDELDRETVVHVVDLADPTSPEVVESTTIVGSLSEARLHGSTVRLVLSSPLPDLNFRFPGGSSGTRDTERHNEQMVRESRLEDWVPTVDGEPVVPCEDMAVPTERAALGTTTVVAFDPTAPTDLAGTGVATAAATSYFSDDRFYLATSPWLGGWVRDCFGPCILPWNGDGDPDGTTRLYAFALDGTDTTYVASGEVDGSIKDRWSMDAVGDSLRVAVGPTTETGDFNSVVTLREEGTSLIEVGRVDKLGVGEEIKSVRWFDDLAIVVTFRQVDPLYAIDLSDPADPELLGELKIPGFSEYLHPLGERRLLGLGQDANLRGMTRGAQASLFDVTDLTDPRQLDVVHYDQDTQARAGLDPRQFTWLPDRRTVLTVISQGWGGRTGWVSVLTLEGGGMDNRMVEVEYGSDIDEVRLVPLASGKVVLVTGEDVSFFNV